MPKRGSEPDEALGPAIDGLGGLDGMENVQPQSMDAPEMPEAGLPMPLEDEVALAPVYEDEIPVLLVFGQGPEAQAVGRLASACGFDLEVALAEAPADFSEIFPDAQKMRILPDYLDIVDNCEMDRNFYVCIFVKDAGECETILSQCLASHAAYIGLMADREKRGEIYAMLKKDGAPDAELAAVCCPMGLPLGAENPEQKAVSIVAELLAARAGTLKRLRYED